jgi:peptide/nickel transport system permease protein
VWGQFRKNRLAMFGLALILLLFGVAILAPFLANDRPIYVRIDGTSYWFANIIEYSDLAQVDFRSWQPGDGERIVRSLVPHDPLEDNLLVRLTPPSKAHWLGTDDRGRDVLSRMIWGTRISMRIGFVAVGISMAIGLVVGALAGYYGGWVDMVVQRIIEVVMCFPSFFLILALMAFLPPSIWNIMIVLGLLGWTGIARLVRGEFLKLRDSDFAVAARATGFRDSWIMFRHLLPNALAPVWVSATFGVAGAILTESGLSFLGFGVPPPTASWGEVLKQSQQYINYAWWLVTFPGAAIFITVTAFNLVGEGLRDAMDPRLRQ